MKILTLNITIFDILNICLLLNCLYNKQNIILHWSVLITCLLALLHAYIDIIWGRSLMGLWSSPSATLYAWYSSGWKPSWRSTTIRSPGPYSRVCDASFGCWTSSCGSSTGTRTSCVLCTGRTFALQPNRHSTCCWGTCCA